MIDPETLARLTVPILMLYLGYVSGKSIIKKIFKKKKETKE